jgi:hypothetical protein
MYLLPTTYYLPAARPAIHLRLNVYTVRTFFFSFSAQRFLSLTRRITPFHEKQRFCRADKLPIRQPVQLQDAILEQAGADPQQATRSATIPRRDPRRRSRLRHPHWAPKRRQRRLTRHARRHPEAAAVAARLCGWRRRRPSSRGFAVPRQAMTSPSVPILEDPVL